MQSAVIGIQHTTGELDPSSGRPGSFGFGSMDVGSLDKGFLDHLGSAPLEQELDIRFTLGAAPPQPTPAATPPSTARQPAAAAPPWPPAISAGKAPFPQRAQQPAAAATPWSLGARTGVATPPPVPQPWSECPRSSMLLCFVDEHVLGSQACPRARTQHHAQPARSSPTVWDIWQVTTRWRRASSCRTPPG